jgi:hypothetical protein
MSKRISFLITALFLLFVSVILSLPKDAFAGVIQLPQTGQTKCYDSAGIEIVCSGTGQDGEIRAGNFKE